MVGFTVAYLFNFLLSIVNFLKLENFVVCTTSTCSPLISILVREMSRSRVQIIKRDKNKMVNERNCVLQYGLYGSFLGCFIYVIFGSCKDTPMGPSAIISLLTYQTVSHLDAPLQHAILLCFLAGLIELIMGIFGLGKYLQHILSAYHLR